MNASATWLGAPGAALAAAVLLGLLGGAAFYASWRRLVPPSFTRMICRRLPVQARAMLSCEDPSQMLAHYGALVTTIGHYAGRSSLALALGLMPMAAFFLLLAALDPSGRLAAQAEAHPAAAVAKDAAPAGAWSSDGDRWLLDREAGRQREIRLAGTSVDGSTLDRKHAYCRPGLGCLLFEMMLFETHAVTNTDAAAPLVVRPAVLDRNPLWPYLNDLDFWFFVSAMLGSGGAALFHGAAKVRRR